MLASTMQFSNNDPSPTSQHPTGHRRRDRSTRRSTPVPPEPNSVPDTARPSPRSTLKKQY